MNNKVIETKVDQLIFDDANANKGTQFGQHLVENSLRQFGAGRSILLDKNNRIIAGNKTVENAGAIGLEDVLIVETTGKQIVAVKRMDIDLDSKEGRELAIADNASAKANIDWDQENLDKITAQWEIDPADWGIPEFKPEEDEEDEPEEDEEDEPEEDEEDEPEEVKKDISTRLIVECGDLSKLSLLFSELQDRGFKCELKE